MRSNKKEAILIEHRILSYGTGTASSVVPVLPK